MSLLFDKTVTCASVSENYNIYICKRISYIHCDEKRYMYIKPSYFKGITARVRYYLISTLRVGHKGCVYQHTSREMIKLVNRCVALLATSRSLIT